MSTITSTPDQASIYAQKRLGDMPPHIADAIREAMYADGYLQDHGDGDMKTFSPFDDMEDHYYWLREAYTLTALKNLAEKEEPPKSAVEQAQEALDAWDAAHQLESIDPGMQSMRFHESQAKRDKKLNAYLNRLGRENRERSRLVGAVTKAKRAERAAALPSEPVDPATLKGATAVMVLTRGYAQWHRVIRVNKTTVTCWAAPGFDQPRFPHNRIFDVRHPEEKKA